MDTKTLIGISVLLVIGILAGWLMRGWFTPKPVASLARIELRTVRDSVSIDSLRATLHPVVRRERIPGEPAKLVHDTLTVFASSEPDLADADLADVIAETDTTVRTPHYEVHISTQYSYRARMFHHAVDVEAIADSLAQVILPQLQEQPIGWLETLKIVAVAVGAAAIAVLSTWFAMK